MRGVANRAQVQHPIIGLSGGMIKGDGVSGGAGEAFGFGIVAGRPGSQIGGGERGGQFRAAFHEFHVPGSGDFLRRASCRARRWAKSGRPTIFVSKVRKMRDSPGSNCR